MKYTKGFNIIELAIVLLIIGILASIAIPNYQQYALRARRSDGIATLLEIMQLEERFFVENRRYTTNLADLGLEVNVNGFFDTNNGFYQLTAGQCNGFNLNQCVLLSAIPVGIQTGDVTFTLNSIGERTPLDFWN